MNTIIVNWQELLSLHIPYRLTDDKAEALATGHSVILTQDTQGTYE